jgi:type I restriction enzyme R subunit
LYTEFREKNKGRAENINDDIVFEMELIKQVEVNIDYILELIRKYHHGHMKDKEIVATIDRAIDSSLALRNKKELIDEFIQNLSRGSSVDGDWPDFVSKEKEKELQKIIGDENLNDSEAKRFMENAFRDGYVQSTGTSFARILPPISRFSPSGDRTKKRERVLEKLSAFFNRFRDISPAN